MRKKSEARDKIILPKYNDFHNNKKVYNALLKLIKSWKEAQDKNGYSAAILMDLSKVFDTIKHDLVITKLHAYGIRGISLKLLKSYLSNRFQTTKIGGEFSTWEELLIGVPSY